MNDALNVLLVLAGVEQDGLEGCPLALEDILVTVVQAHHCLDDPHPRLDMVLELGMQILIVQVVEYFHKHFQHYHILHTLRVLLNSL